MSETSSSTHGKTEEQKPRRTRRRMKAAIRFSSQRVKEQEQSLRAIVAIHHFRLQTEL